jgi:hypothetical protein
LDGDLVATFLCPRVDSSLSVEANIEIDRVALHLDDYLPDVGGGKTGIIRHSEKPTIPKSTRRKYVNLPVIVPTKLIVLGVIETHKGAFA